MNEQKPTHLRHLDLFGGIGMFSLAARWAGIETIAISEIDPHASRILSHRFPAIRNLGDVRRLCKRAFEYRSVDAEEEMLWCDLCNQEFGECACIGTDQFADDYGYPDIVTAGSPCQGFSLNGEGLGLDDPRSVLIKETLRINGELRPRFLLIENVPAIKSRGADTVIEALETNGYSTQAFVVGASDLKGGRHKRKRAWIVAYDTTQRIQGVRAERLQESHSLAPTLLPLGGRDGQWEVEPDLRRTDARHSRWMDRLACIGNSIVPQIPVMFFDWMREVTRKERFDQTIEAC